MLCNEILALAKVEIVDGVSKVSLESSEFFEVKRRYGENKDLRDIACLFLNGMQFEYYIYEIQWEIIWTGQRYLWNHLDPKAIIK